MATFNPDQGPQSPDDTAASRGVKANTAYADLFGAAGEIGVAAVKIKDQDNLIGIQKEVNSEVDQLNNEWGTNASAFETNIANPNNTQPLPSDVQRYGKHLGDVRKAYLNGSLKDSNYQMRIDSLSRQIRARYPGYREQIDGIIQKTLGLSTANDLRKSLMQQWAAEETATSDAQKAYDTFTRKAREDGVLPPQWDVRNANGQPYSEAETKAYVAAQYQMNADIARQKSAYDLQGKASDANREQLANIAQREIAQVQQKVVENGLSVGGQSWSQIQQKVQQGQVKPWSPEETAQIAASFSQMSSAMEAGLWSKVNDPFYNNLKPEQKKALVEQGMAHMNIIKDQITNQQFGLLNMSKTMNETGAQDGLRNWQTENPVIYQSRIAKLYADGSPVLDSLMLSNPEMSSQINNALTQLMTVGIADPSKASMQQVLAEAKNKQGGELAPEVIKQTVKNATQVLLKKDVSIEMATQAAKILFSEENQGFLGDFTQKSQTQLFDALITPRMTARIAELAQDNPEIATNYRNWVLNSFTSLFNQDIATINDMNQFGDNLQINWDAAAGQFKASPGANVAEGSRAKASLPGGTLAQMYESWANSAANDSMKNLNKYIKQLKPIIEAEGGTAEDALTALFESQGVGKAKNQGSLYFRLYNAITSAPEEGKAIGVGKGASKEAIEKVIRPENPELQGFDLDSTPTGKMKSDTPRGIRNNNPGNIEFGDYAKSKGAKQSDGRFAKFDTPEQGIQAMGDLLRNYQKKGFDTVSDMINRWAPNTENDTSAYIKKVSKAMGIDPDEPFLFEGELAEKMVSAMIEHENGQNPYGKK